MFPYLLPSNIRPVLLKDMTTGGNIFLSYSPVDFADVRAQRPEPWGCRFWPASNTESYSHHRSSESQDLKGKCAPSSAEVPLVLQKNTEIDAVVSL